MVELESNWRSSDWSQTGDPLKCAGTLLAGAASIREGQEAGISPEQQGYAPLWPTVNGADKHLVRPRAGGQPHLEGDASWRAQLGRAGQLQAAATCFPTLPLCMAGRGREGSAGVPRSPRFQHDCVSTHLHTRSIGLKEGTPCWAHWRQGPSLAGCTRPQGASRRHRGPSVGCLLCTA
jgi:hypothetical protein